MAHEVDQMAYTGQVPWHGLGNNINPASSIEEWQIAAGLDWSVSKRPVLYEQLPANVSDYNFSRRAFKDKFVLVRDTDERPFSVVSNRYKPVQPKEILEFFRSLIADFGMTVETAGSLRDGQRVWALAKTGDAHKVMGVDKVDGYLMLATSYDLTFSTLAQFTSVRVVCNNTLQQSFANHTGRVTIPHFREFDMEAVKTELGVGLAQWQSYTAMLEALAQIKLDLPTAEKTIGKIFQIDTNDEPESKINAPKIVHCNNVFELFKGKAIGADIAGQTGWGLVNATTEYLDKYKRARSQGNRLDSAWFGDSFNLKQRAVDETLLLAA